MSVFQLQDGMVLQTQITMVTITCCSCGVPFAVPERLQKEFRASKQTFYCPNGHSMSYKQSQLDRIREELQSKEWLLKQKQEALDRERADNLALRRTLTRTKNKLKAADGQLTRVKNGVCPCCNRTFQNLMKHMETQHPEYKPETA